jgi:hypothetical protein
MPRWADKSGLNHTAGKCGNRHHVITDDQDVPLAVTLAATNGGRLDSRGQNQAQPQGFDNTLAGFPIGSATA